MTTVVTFVRRGRMISTVGVGSTVLQTRVNQTAKKRGRKGGQQRDPSDRHGGYAAMPDRAPRQSDGKLAFQVPHPMPSLPPPPPLPQADGVANTREFWSCRPRSANPVGQHRPHIRTVLGKLPGPPRASVGQLSSRRRQVAFQKPCEPGKFTSGAVCPETTCMPGGPLGQAKGSGKTTPNGSTTNPPLEITRRSSVGQPACCGPTGGPTRNQGQ